MKMLWALRVSAVVAVLGVVLLSAGTGVLRGDARRYRLTLITKSRSSRFDDAWTCGATLAARRLGVDVVVRRPRQRDDVLQTMLVEQVARQRPDAVLIAPTDARAMLVPIMRLAARGPKVVVVGTSLGRSSPAVSEVASDLVRGGADAAHAIEHLVRDVTTPRDRTESHWGRMGLIGGGWSPARSKRLTQGFVTAHDRIATRVRYAGAHLLGKDPDTVTAVALMLVPGQPKLRFVIATDSHLAQAVWLGLVGAGLGEGIHVVTWGADRRNVANLERSMVSALFVEHSREIGARAVEQAVAAIRGQPTTQRILTGWTLVRHERLAGPAARRALRGAAGC